MIQQRFIDYCERKSYDASLKAEQAQSLSAWRWYFMWERIWYHLSWLFL